MPEVLIWVGLAGAAVASLTTVFVGVRGIWRIVRRIVYITDAVAQLKPNGGSSIHDKVMKMHTTVQEIDNRVKKLESTRWIKF